MSDDLTARIDEALAGTTPGPWHWGDRTNLLGIGGDVSPGGYVYSVDVLEIEHDGGCGCRRMCQMDVTLSDEDRTLIAAAPSLLAEARDEIARLRERLQDSWYVDIGERLDAAVAESERLREGIREHKRDALCNGSLYARERTEALWALLDAGDALNVGPDTTGEGT